MSNFTMVENQILLNANLSLDTKGLYSLIKYYSTIPNFNLKRNHLKSIANVGETAFRRMWKELKEADLIETERKHINGKFDWVITLKAPVVKNETKTKTKTKKVIVDSEGKPPLENQIYIDEVLEENKATEVIEEVQEVEEASNNMSLINSEFGNIKATKEEKDIINQEEERNVIQAIREVKEQGIKVTSLKYLVNKINFIKNKSTNSSTNGKVLNFNDFEQRQYSDEYLKQLERKLLGWD